jgi:pilus assembly protein CpaB
MAAKPRAFIIAGVLAVAIAAFASYSLYNYLKGQEKKISEAVASERIVVAADQIPIGTPIIISQLKMSDWPKANMPQGTFISTQPVVGRIALQTFMPGDPITESRLIPKEGPVSVLTYKIPEGHRAMTVGVDQVSGVAGFINPGNMVDVVLTIAPVGASQSISKIVLQNVPVLAIGQAVENREGKAIVVPTVTMDVTPEDAEKLAVASTQGRLQLVLRRFEDKSVARTVGATVTNVMSGAAVRQAPKAVKTARVTGERKEEVKKPLDLSTSVEVWRGPKRTIETFKVKKGDT